MSLDGELEGREAQTVRSHLDCCWSCRSRCERLQAGISAFIDYHDSVLTPMVKSSPDSWGNFGNRLQNAVEESVKNISWFQHLISRFNLSRFQLNQVLAIRSAVAGFLIAALLTAFLFFGQRQTVSAAELLKNADAAGKNSLSAVSEPVRHQKLQIRRSKNSGQPEAINWETWEDASRSNFRQAVDTIGIRQLIS